MQPHVLVGGSIPWLTVKDGGFLNDDVGNARFRGYGVNTEAGVTVYPHPRMGIGVGYSYRVMWFDRATGVSETLYDLRPRFRETSGSVVMTGSSRSERSVLGAGCSVLGAQCLVLSTARDHLASLCT